MLQEMCEQQRAMRLHKEASTAIKGGSKTVYGVILQTLTFLYRSIFKKVFFCCKCFCKKLGSLELEKDLLKYSVLKFIQRASHDPGTIGLCSDFANFTGDVFQNWLVCTCRSLLIMSSTTFYVFPAL